MVCVDADYLYIGETNGKEVRQVLYKESRVPHKHGKGGQSEQRFKRARKEALKHWFKEVAEYLSKSGKSSDFRKDRPIYLGIHPVYSQQLKGYMDTESRNSIIYEKSVSIDDNCMWELIGVSRYEI